MLTLYLIVRTFEMLMLLNFSSAATDCQIFLAAVPYLEAPSEGIFSSPSEILEECRVAVIQSL